MKEKVWHRQECRRNSPKQLRSSLFKWSRGLWGLNSLGENKAFLVKSTRVLQFFKWSRPAHWRAFPNTLLSLQLVQTPCLRAILFRFFRLRFATRFDLVNIRTEKYWWNTKLYHFESAFQRHQDGLHLMLKPKDMIVLLRLGFSRIAYTNLNFSYLITDLVRMAC